MLKKATRLSPAATAAAAWWANAIGAPTFRHVNDEERTDITDLTQMMATMVASKHEVSEDAGTKFAAELAKAIDKELDPDKPWRTTLGVDYGPDRMLAEAAEKAGIHTSRFPWKTNMWIRHDHVTVSAGYQAAPQLVWASDEWLANRPLCTSQKWDRNRDSYLDYHGEPWVCSLPMYHDGDCVYDRPMEVEER